MKIGKRIYIILVSSGVLFGIYCCWIVSIIGRGGSPQIWVYADVIEKSAITYVAETGDNKFEIYINAPNGKIRIGNEFADASIPEEECVSYLEARHLEHKFIGEDGKTYGPYMSKGIVDSLLSALSETNENIRAFVVFAPDPDFKLLSFVVVTNGDLPKYDYKTKKITNAIRVYVRREFRSKIGDKKVEEF